MLVGYALGELYSTQVKYEKGTKEIKQADISQFHILG
jgi:hypothetical protein